MSARGLIRIVVRNGPERTTTDGVFLCALNDLDEDRYETFSSSLISQSSQKRNDIVDLLLAQSGLVTTFATIRNLFHIDIHVILDRQVVELRYDLARLTGIPIFGLYIATDIKGHSIAKIFYLAIMKKHLPCGDVT